MTEADLAGAGRTGTAAAFEQATIYLADASVGDFDQLIRRVEDEDTSGYRRLPLAPETGLDGVVYVAEYGMTDPGWKEALASLVGDELRNVAVRQAGAALLLRLA